LVNIYAGARTLRADCAISELNRRAVELRVDRRRFVSPDDGTMARSVVLKKSPRCERCQLPPRWCICAGFQAVDGPFKVDVLMHHMEAWRPSSTGHLIQRVMPAAGLHLYRRERPLDPAAILQPGKTLWILHPLGEPLPAAEAPANLQVLLLDGTWRQAGEMMRAVEPWGRKISLPMTGRSRYWLRSQAGEGKFCTIEALLFLLSALGREKEHAQLRLQFELHVYAGLCARGAKAKAAEYLAESPVRTALPGLLDELARHRSRDAEA
jgi:DTW domain-containing protein YfiP